MNATNATPDLLTPHEVAAMLRVHRVTLSKMHTAGMMPTAINVGKQQRWPRVEIEAWIAAGCPARAEWDERKRQAEEQTKTKGKRR